MENIKRDYYSFPTQVYWGEMDDYGDIHDNWGIAFQDRIICSHCGEPLYLNDESVMVFKELEWVDFAYAIEDETVYSAAEETPNVDKTENV